MPATLPRSGPQGPPGPPGTTGATGPPGPHAPAFEHVQAVPSAVWTIDHDLATFPSVTVLDSAGSVVIGQIEYPSNSQVVLRFSGAFAGRAYLNA